MTYVESWEEFAKAAERLYSQSPWKVSVHTRLLLNVAGLNFNDSACFLF